MIDIDGIEDARWEMKKCLIWVCVNIVLLLGGLASFVIAAFPLLLIGLVIFCPISIGKNVHKYFKIKKHLDEYMNQFKNY